MNVDGHDITDTNDDDDNNDDNNNDDDNLDHRLRRSWQLAITSKGFSQPPKPITTSSISHRHCDGDDCSDDDFDYCFNDDFDVYFVDDFDDGDPKVFPKHMMSNMLLVVIILMIMILSTFRQYFPKATSNHQRW